MINAMSQFLNLPFLPVFIIAIPVAILTLIIFALIRYLRGLSTKERRKLLLCVLLFPFVVIWAAATGGCHCGRCPRCGWYD